MLEAHDVTFGASAHRARHMQRGGLRRPARQDEGAERLQLGLGVVDGLLELRDAALVDPRLLEMLRHLIAVGGGEQRTDREQIALHGHEHLVDARHQLDGASHPEDGIQLVDVAVGFDARIVLRNPSAAEEPRVAAITGLRVDLHVGQDSEAGR